MLGKRKTTIDHDHPEEVYLLQSPMERTIRVGLEEKGGEESEKKCNVQKKIRFFFLNKSY